VRKTKLGGSIVHRCGTGTAAGDSCMLCSEREMGTCAGVKPVDGTMGRTRLYLQEPPGAPWWEAKLVLNLRPKGALGREERARCAPASPNMSPH